MEVSAKKVMTGVLSLAIGAGIGFLLVRALSGSDSPVGDAETVGGKNKPLTALVDTAALPEGISHFDARLALERRLCSAGISAASRLRTLERMRDRGMDVRAAMAAWAARDPEAFLNFVIEANSPHLASLWMATPVALRALWRQDPERAEELALAQRNYYRIREALRPLVLEAIESGEIDAAGRLVAKYLSYFDERFSNLTPHENQVVAEIYSQLPDSERAAKMIGALAYRWATRDLDAAKEWAMGLPPGRGRELAFSNLMGEAKSLELYDELREAAPDWRPSGNVMNIVGQARYKDDPTAGVEWATQNLRSYHRGGFYTAATESLLAKGDVQGAIDLLPHLPPGYRYAGVEPIARQLGSEDPEVGIRWALSLGNSGARGALHEFAGRWAAKNPAEARALVEDPEVPPFPEMVGKIAAGMAYQDPAAALTWLEQFSDERRGNAFSEAVIGWARKDPAGALAHSMALPRGDLRDKLVQTTGNRLIRTDVDAAVAWMGGLSYESDRRVARIAINKAGAKGEARVRLLEALGEE